MNERLLKAELYKVKREIQIHGSTYTICRNKKDEYGEATSESEEICAVSGLFHISKGYITKTISDGTRTHTKGQPQLLLEYSESSKIENDDYIMINNQKYNITEKNNIQEYNIIVDISLELVLDDRN